METLKQVVVDTLRTHPLAVMLAVFVLAIMPGIVKLAELMPKAN